MVMMLVPENSSCVSKDYDAGPIATWVAVNRDSTGWIRSATQLTRTECPADSAGVLGMLSVQAQLLLKRVRGSLSLEPIVFRMKLALGTEASQQRVANGPFPHEKPATARRRPARSNGQWTFVEN